MKKMSKWMRNDSCLRMINTLFFFRFYAACDLCTVSEPAPGQLSRSHAVKWCGSFIQMNNYIKITKSTFRPVPKCSSGEPALSCVITERPQAPMQRSTSRSKPLPPHHQADPWPPHTPCWPVGGQSPDLHHHPGPPSGLRSASKYESKPSNRRSASWQTPWTEQGVTGLMTGWLDDLMLQWLQLPGPVHIPGPDWWKKQHLNFLRSLKKVNKYECLRVCM